ncbi:MAG: phage tail tape measure protein, partial [Ruthenibacterium sp.]
MSNEVRAGAAYVEIFTKDGNLNAGLKSAQEKLRSFGNAVQVIGGDMIRFGTMASVPFLLAGKAFADFDDQMRTVKAISGASEQQLSALTDKARELGATTAFTAQQVAEGETNLSRMGFSADETVQSIEHMLNLTRATGTETFRLAEVSTFAANAMRIFKLDASQAADVADVMAYSANQSSQDIFDFGEAIKIAGPSAQTMGEDLRDASAMTMLLADSGIRGSLAGTALRKVYQSLAAQTGDWTEEGAAAATQLQEMGIQLTDSSGNMRKASDIMYDLADAVKQMKSGEKINFTTDVFDLRGSLGALAMLQSPERLKYFRQGLDNVSGLAKRTAAEIESGPGGALREFFSQLADLGIETGKQLATVFVPFLEILTSCLKGIKEFVKNHGTLVAMVGGGAVLIAAAGLALIGFGLACKVAAAGIGGLAFTTGFSKFFKKTSLDVDNGSLSIDRYTKRINRLYAVIRKKPKAINTAVPMLKIKDLYVEYGRAYGRRADASMAAAKINRNNAFKGLNIKEISSLHNNINPNSIGINKLHAKVNQNLHNIVQERLKVIKLNNLVGQVDFGNTLTKSTFSQVTSSFALIKHAFRRFSTTDFARGMTAPFVKMRDVAKQSFKTIVVNGTLAFRGLITYAKAYGMAILGSLASMALVSAALYGISQLVNAAQNRVDKAKNAHEQFLNDRRLVEGALKDSSTMQDPEQFDLVSEAAERINAQLGKQVVIIDYINKGIKAYKENLEEVSAELDSKENFMLNDRIKALQGKTEKTHGFSQRSYNGGATNWDNLKTQASGVFGALSYGIRNIFSSTADMQNEILNDAAELNRLLGVQHAAKIKQADANKAKKETEESGSSEYDDALKKNISQMDKMIDPKYAFGSIKEASKYLDDFYEQVEKENMTAHQQKIKQIDDEYNKQRSAIYSLWKAEVAKPEDKRDGLKIAELQTKASQAHAIYEQRITKAKKEQLDIIKEQGKRLDERIKQSITSRFDRNEEKSVDNATQQGWGESRLQQLMTLYGQIAQNS